MRPCTLRIASAEEVIKATSLNDSLVEHAPWCRAAPAALLIHIKPLDKRPRPFRGAAVVRSSVEVDRCYLIRPSVFHFVVKYVTTSTGGAT